MKYITVVIVGLLLIPSVSFASTLTPSQVSAIVEVLQAFGVADNIVAEVRAELTPAPIKVVTEPTNTFTPIQTNTPTFGSVEVVQATSSPVIPSCDDTPTISVKSVDGQSSSFTMASTSYLEFIVSASSSCGNAFSIDEYSPSQPRQRHINEPSGVRGQSFYFTSAPPGSYQVYFVAHDTTTAATSTVNVTVTG